MDRRLKIVVEKHPEEYVAYPLGLRDAAIGAGDGYEDAPDTDSPVLEDFVDETTLGA